MIKNIIKLITSGESAFLVILIAIMIAAASWLTTCGLVWVLAVCFGFSFTWKLATGLWIVWIILIDLFGKKE